MKKLLFFTSLFITTTTFAQTILRYSDHEQLGNMRTKFFKEVLFKNIQEESKGRLKIDDHWNCEISTSYDALKAVAEKNLADITVVVPEYVGTQWSHQLLFKSFPTGPSGEKQVKLIKKLYKNIPHFNTEIEKSGVKNLMVATGCPVAFFSTKKLNSLNDIFGEKWRTASFWRQDFLRKYGAEPVRTPWSDETTNALQNSSLNGVMVNIDGGNEFGISKAAPNVLTSKNLWMGHVYVLAMNKQTWENLPKKDQRAIQRAVKKSYKVLGKLMDQSFDEEVHKLRNQNPNVRILNQAELLDFQQKQIIKICSKNGFQNKLKAVSPKCRLSLKK